VRLTGPARMAWGHGRLRGTEGQSASQPPMPPGRSRRALKLTVLEDEFCVPAIGPVASCALVGRKTGVAHHSLEVPACDIERLKHSSGRVGRLKALLPSGLESAYPT
jgi:hypothetical protein